MSTPQKKKINPNATFISVSIENKKIFAYIDTGATLCLARKNVCSNWEPLRNPIRITVADKSIHSINYVARMVTITINKSNFIAKTIYLHDSGLDLIIGNNFLKLYAPFTQFKKKISLKNENKIIYTPIILIKEVLKLVFKNLNHTINLVNISIKQVEQLLDEVCSDNPLDKDKNLNDQLIEIKLKDPTKEVKVINKIPYSVKDVSEFTEECKELLEKGIIRESKSPHSSPAFYVENHNEIKRGKRRMVINYKKINEATIGDSYNLPRKDYILEKIKGSKWFSTLDAKSGFWQLRLHENTKPLTAFTCPPQKQYEWNVLPFGLKQAPSIYQRFMDSILAGLEDFCLAYIDDIIIFSKTNESDHLDKVLQTLERCKTKGLIISKKKSFLLQNEVEYLGLKIGSNGNIQLTNTVQEKIKLFPDELPDRKSIQRFLGCLNYISEQGFIKGLSKERSLLQKMISEKQPWKWLPEATRAVKTIKEGLKSLPCLYNPSEQDFLVIMTDASSHSWAGVMLALPEGKKQLGMDDFGNPMTSIINQEDLEETRDQPSESGLKGTHICIDKKYFPKTEKSPLRLCKYVNGTFSATEKNYPIHELEVLACVKTLKKWRIELLQTRFELRTDSRYVTGFLKYKLEEPTSRGRLIRWQLQLHQYQPYIRFIKSEDNPVADTFTREWSPLSKH